MNDRYKIAVVRALQLGDLLVAVPALRSLRAGFPGAEITLIGLPWAADFARRFHRYVDRFLPFPGYPGIGEVPVESGRAERFIAAQQAYGYDLVVQMHGSGVTSNPFALALGGRATAGYYEGAPQVSPPLAAREGAAGPPAGLDPAAPYPHDAPEVLRNLRLAYLLNCPDQGVDLEFPLHDDDYAEADDALSGFTGTWPLVGMHPGARPPARRWPTDYFARVADHLTRRFGARIVLTGGAEEEGTVRAVAAAMSEQPLILAGRTSLGGLAAVLGRLDLFVGNDTGPAHLAEAVGAPTVTVFGPADPARWAPLDAARHPIVRRPVVCSPCGHWECPIDHRCLRWLGPESVANVADTLLLSTSTRGLREREGACDA